MDKAIGLKKVSAGTLMEDAEVGVIHFTPRGEAFMVNSSKGKRASVNRSYYLSGPSMIYIDDTGFAAASYTITNYDSFENYSIQVNNGIVTRNENIISITGVTLPGTLRLTVNGEVSEIDVIAGNILLTNTELQVITTGYLPYSGKDNRAFVTSPGSNKIYLWNEVNQSFSLEQSVSSPSYVGTPPRTTSSFGTKNAINYDENIHIVSDPRSECFHAYKLSGGVWGRIAGIYNTIITPPGMTQAEVKAYEQTLTSGIVRSNNAADIDMNGDGTLFASSYGKVVDKATMASHIECGIELFHRNEDIVTRGQCLIPSNSIHRGNYSSTMNDQYPLRVVVAKDSSLVVLANYTGDQTVFGDGLGNITCWNGAGDIWEEFSSPVSPNPAMKGFAASISTNAKGDILAVSQCDVSGSSGLSGRVHVYSRNLEGWDLIGTILPPNLEAGDTGALFGMSVDLSDDGGKLIIGFPGGIREGVACGRAFAYRLFNGVWALETEFTHAGSLAGDKFGSNVCITGTGRRVLIGALGILKTFVFK